MIQDIAPHQWKITYKNSTPEEESVILFFYQDTVLVMKEEEENTLPFITFPKYKEVCSYVKTSTYLFSLDEVMMFRVEIRSQEECAVLTKVLSACAQQQKMKISWEDRRFFRTAQPKELSFAAITGMHVNGWYQKNRFCGACGKLLIHDERERMLRCPNCSNLVYPRINPAVIVGVTYKNQILLTKYRGRAHKNYALIAGFNEIGESLEDTVRREVFEETGLRVKHIKYYKSQPWGFTDNILMGYFCELDGAPTITMDEEELSLAKWFFREELPKLPQDLSLTNEMIDFFALDKLQF